MELQAVGLEQVHERVRALAGVDVAVRAGERVLVLGWTGAGKTSLLKALAGLTRPFAGKVLWDGADLWALPANERRERQAAFGMVFQADALFDSLSVLGNVELPLLRRGASAEAATKRAREVLAQVGLSDAEATFPERLSGGMKKRAGLARALAAKPEVLLADDPLSGLDPATGNEIALRVAEAAEGKTLVWAAPEPPTAIVFPRWLWLEEGRMTYDGPPRPSLLDTDEALP